MLFKSSIWKWRKKIIKSDFFAIFYQLAHTLRYILEYGELQGSTIFLSAESFQMGKIGFLITFIRGASLKLPVYRNSFCSESHKKYGFILDAIICM